MDQLKHSCCKKEDNEHSDEQGYDPFEPPADASPDAVQSPRRKAGNDYMQAARGAARSDVLPASASERDADSDDDMVEALAAAVAPAEGGREPTADPEAGDASLLQVTRSDAEELQEGANNSTCENEAASSAIVLAVDSQQSTSCWPAASCRQKEPAAAATEEDKKMDGQESSSAHVAEAEKSAAPSSTDEAYAAFLAEVAEQDAAGGTVEKAACDQKVTFQDAAPQAPQDPESPSAARAADGSPASACGVAEEAVSKNADELMSVSEDDSARPELSGTATDAKSAECNEQELVFV